MLRKQLITLACAAGVLMCGACGLTFRDRPLPPPPMTLFVGIRTVRVVVTNSSSSHQIEVTGVRDALVKEFNARSNHAHFVAVTEGDADCTLSLDIVHEDQAEPISDPPLDGVLIHFSASISAKLTGKQGQQLWADPNWTTQTTYGFYHLHGRTITNGWSDAGSSRQFNSALASQIVGQLLSK